MEWRNIDNRLETGTINKIVVTLSKSADIIPVANTSMNTNNQSFPREIL